MAMAYTSKFTKILYIILLIANVGTLLRFKSLLVNNDGYPPATAPQGPRYPRTTVQALQRTAQSYMFTPVSATLSELIAAECYDGHVVPDVVHYVTVGQTQLRFYQYISMLSAYRYLEPCYIVYHGDGLPHGRWWDTLMMNLTRVLYVHTRYPDTIFGQKLAHVEHSADVVRLQVLIEYGGIYLDTDIVVLRSFEPLRSHNLTLDRHTHTGAVSNAVMVAAKNSPLLQIWLLAYNEYKREVWGYNSVMMAGKLTRAFPKLARVEKWTMSMPGTTEHTDVESKRWKANSFSVQLFASRFVNKAVGLDHILTSNTTFALLCRHTLYGSIAEMPNGHLR